MALKLFLESLDEVNEPLREHYTETEDGTFFLDVEGVDDHPSVKNLKTAHETQKGKNRTLSRELDGLKKKLDELPEDFDPAKWEEYKARIEALEDEIGDPDDPENKDKDKLKIVRDQVEAKWRASYEKLERELNDKLAGAEGQTKHYKGSLHAVIAKHELAKALMKSKVIEPLMGAAEALHIGKIEVLEEDGKFTPIVKADDIEQTVAEYIEAWALSEEGKAMIAADKNTGGGKKGDEGDGGKKHDNPWKTGNLTEQAQIIQLDYGKACRLAREAGKREPRKPSR